MFKQEQERITRELDNARGRLAAISLEYQTIEDNLNHALRLARDSHAAYKLATPKMRRLFNQAFFMVGSNNAQQTSGSLLAWSES